MVVRPRPGLVTILFTLRGSILPQVAPQVLGIAAVAGAVTAVERRWPEPFPLPAGIGAFTLFGLALSIFLSFRNGACYDRWWEARRVWGTVITETRGLARALNAALPEWDERRHRCLRRLSGFAHALRAGLRGVDPARPVSPFLPPGEVRTLASRPSAADAVLAALLADLGQAMR